MKRIWNFLLLLLLFFALALPAEADTKLPSHMKSIQAEAFRNDTSLKGKLILPEGVTDIGAYAFSGCTGLTEVTISESVLSIGEGAFSGCTNLRITILSPDVIIASGAFDHCLDVQMLATPRPTATPSPTPRPTAKPTPTIRPTSSPTPVVEPTPPADHTPLEHFDYTVNGEEVSIRMYHGRDNLVVIPDTIEGKPVTSIGLDAFAGNQSIGTLHLSENIHTIGKRAFLNCTELQAVYGAENVILFDTEAMAGCEKLQYLQISPNTERIEAYAFKNTKLSGTIYGEEGKLNLSAIDGTSLSAVSYTVNAADTLTIYRIQISPDCTELSIPSSINGRTVTAIGSNITFTENSVKTIILPSTVMSIDSFAFKNFIHLEEVYGSFNVESFGQYAFADCAKLEYMEFGQNIYKIDMCAFENTLLRQTICMNGGHPDFFVAGKSDFLASAFQGSGLIAFCMKTTENGNAEFSRMYAGNKADVSEIFIPETYQDYAITTIGDRAFEDAAGMKKIFLPEALHTVGSYAFIRCSDLAAVHGAENISHYGGYAFYDCSNLETIEISGDVQSIGDYAFLNTPKLQKSFCFPDEYRDSSISSQAFYYSGITALFYDVTENNTAVITGMPYPLEPKSVSIPEKAGDYPVTAIADSAFQGMDYIIAAEFPQTMRSIGANAFSSCSQLASVSGAERVISYGENAFWYCTSLKEMKISNDLVKLGSGAFAECPLEAELYLSADCEIDWNWRAATNDKLAIYSFRVEGNEAALTHFRTGEASSNLLTIPSSYNGIPVTMIDTQEDHIDVSHVIIPAGVHTIGDEAFSGDERLVWIEFAQGSKLTTIGEDAFNWSSLSSIELPDTVTTIGCGAFSYTKLTSFNIPPKVTVIPNYFFVGSSLREIIIPDGVTTIGDDFAKACEELTYIYMPDSVTQVGGCFVTGCTALQEVRLSDSLTYLGNEFFSSCTSLTSVHLPNSLESFGSSVFYNTPNLTQINLPASLQKTMPDTFRGSGIQIQAVNKVVSQVIRSSMSDFEKALALHDWIINQAEFSYGPPEFHGAEGVLVYGYGVCESYMEAYMQLLDAVGISNHPVYGVAGNEYHTWNLVQLDGEWYHIDPTWDDPIGGQENHNYFGLTDEMISEDHFTWQNSSLPAANGTRYQYGVDNHQ